MGILNLTPDSFYDGGRWNALDGAMRELAQRMRLALDLGKGFARLWRGRMTCRSKS